MRASKIKEKNLIGRAELYKTFVNKQVLKHYSTLRTNDLTKTVRETLLVFWSIPIHIFFKCTESPWLWSQSTYKGRGEKGVEYLPLSAGAYTTTLFVMIDIVKGGWHEPPTLTRLGWIHFHSVYSVYSVYSVVLCTCLHLSVVSSG